jgi:hypothetical protein
LTVTVITTVPDEGVVVDPVDVVLSALVVEPEVVELPVVPLDVVDDPMDVVLGALVVEPEVVELPVVPLLVVVELGSVDVVPLLVVVELGSVDVVPLLVVVELGSVALVDVDSDVVVSPELEVVVCSLVDSVEVSSVDVCS